MQVNVSVGNFSAMSGEPDNDAERFCSIDPVR